MTSDSTTAAPVEATTTNNSPTNTIRGRGRGRRNNQRNKSRSQQQTNNTDSSNTSEVNNATVPDNTETVNGNNSNTTNEQRNRQNRRGGGRGRGRGRGRGGTTSDSLARHVRVLGDTTTEENSSGNEALQQQQQQQQQRDTTLNDTKRGGRRGGRARRPPRQKTAVSLEDEDLRGTLTRTLGNDTHECMVCCEVVYRRQATWSCDRCWAVFHLKCVRKWASNVLQQENVTTWRCPGCQQPREAKPKEYRCFCGKRADPEYSREHTPHSCGEPCGHVQRRATSNNSNTDTSNPDCQHPCSLRCHPGPCPPCAAMAPTTFCHCGKESYQIRCTDYRVEGISCGEICGELLGCGLHTCQRECHSGLCAPCGEREHQRCYCGRDSREAACGTGNPQTVLEADNPQQSFTGYYSCGKACQRWYDCNNINASQYAIQRRRRR